MRATKKDIRNTSKFMTDFSQRNHTHLATELYNILPPNKKKEFKIDIKVWIK